MSEYKPRTPEIMKVKELDRDILTQYSCDEIQLVRQQAQSATSNEISFNLKMPDPSALCHSTIWMRVRAQFRMDGPCGNPAGGGGSRANFQSYDRRMRGADKISDNIMMPGGICPLQGKMFDNVSCSVNGVSFQARASEILEPIMRMTVPNRIASKINLPYPTFDRKLVGDDCRCNYTDPVLANGARTRQSLYYVPGDYEWKAGEKWRKQCVEQGGAAGVYESAQAGGEATPQLGPIIEFWEPLTLGPFGPLAQTMECKTLPDWHPYRMQGVGLPNVNRIVINAQLGQNFAGNMCLAVSRGLRLNRGYNDGASIQNTNISLAGIQDVELFATVYKPPQLWVGASQSSYVLPTWAVERWQENIPAGELAEGASREVPLSYHNFDSMPGAFVIFCGPDRASKWSRIAGAAGHNINTAGATFAAQTGNTQGFMDKLFSSRMDKLVSIKQLRLSVNTRSDAFISTRGDSATWDKMALFYMTMKNIRRYNLGFAESDFDCDSWFENYGCIILTVDDISAAIPSANVTSRLNIHGSVTVENNLGYKVNGDDVAACAGYGNVGGAAIPQERFSVFVYSVMNNRAMVLTQVGGEPMKEILPQSFATELKLGGRAQYVGRV